jgi:hypothetical protein
LLCPGEIPLHGESECPNPDYSTFVSTRSEIVADEDLPICSHWVPCEDESHA